MQAAKRRLTFPKISFYSLRRAVIVILIGGGIFSAGYLVGHRGYRGTLKGFPKVVISRELPGDKKDLDFSLFWRTWDTLQAKYFDKSRLDTTNMVYGAIKGMVAALGDPYTIFLTPEENRIVQEDLQGSFEGVGIQIGFKGMQLAVIAPLPGSPAEKAGVKAGDFILAIKDERKGIDRDTTGITLPEAVQAIRGAAGSTVTLTLLREGGEEPFAADIVREEISVPAVTLSYVGEGNDIAQIKISRFTAEGQNEWEAAVLDILKKRQVSGVILDLRNNPGGFLQGAVDVASEFLEGGSVVVIEETDGVRNEFRVEKIARLKNTPAVVLVNGGSASASEILAGALRDHKEIPIVGATTFGKGTIQEPEQVDGGAGLHITIAKWLTPSGYWVDEGGLEPDFKIEDNSETEEDEQLQKAISLLGS